MRLLAPIVAALLAASAQAATVRVLPLKVAPMSDVQLGALARSVEASVRDLTALVPQVAAPATARRCALDDAGCWVGLAAKANADYGLLVVADPAAGLTVDLVLVEVKARRVTQRRFSGAGADAAAQARAAVEAVVPPYLRRGYGGVALDVPTGAKLKVDGRVVAADLGRPVAVPVGRHDIDLLLPDGSAVLRRADVAEGQTNALALALKPPTGERRSNDALMATSAVLWTAGTVAVFSSLLVATIGNVRAQSLTPCLGSNRNCLTLDDARREQQTVAQFMSAANVLLIGGGALAVGGAGVFAFDLVQGGER